MDPSRKDHLRPIYEAINGRPSSSINNNSLGGSYGMYGDVGYGLGTNSSSSVASSIYSTPTNYSHLPPPPSRQYHQVNHIYSTLNNNNIANPHPTYYQQRLQPSSSSNLSPSSSFSEGIRGATGHPHPTQSQDQQQSRYIRSLKNNKVDEVDQLTALLVKSMENSNDPDFFGICFKCNGKVQGEGSGCSAMGQIYHIRCFTCRTCGKQLRGLPFYNVDGNPLCEQDYLNTLEKCSVCSNAILDRILRATGKPYHPSCFTCVVCGKCLDGIPFTVDNANRIHCIEDFHRKFAPRCCVCSRPILPEPGQHETVRIVALDKSYHVNCYRCEDCHVQLTSGEEGRGCYPLDDHILCLKCNTRRVNALTTP